MKIRKLGDAANTGLKGEVVKTAKTYGRLSSQLNIGGQGEIRTHGTIARTAVFKTAALNRSATCP